MLSIPSVCVCLSHTHTQGNANRHALEHPQPPGGETSRLRGTGCRRTQGRGLIHTFLHPGTMPPRKRCCSGEPLARLCCPVTEDAQQWQGILRRSGLPWLTSARQLSHVPVTVTWGPGHKPVLHTAPLEATTRGPCSTGQGQGPASFSGKLMIAQPRRLGPLLPTWPTGLENPAMQVRVSVGSGPAPPYPKGSTGIKKQHRPWNDTGRLNINKIFI